MTRNINPSTAVKGRTTLKQATQRLLLIACVFLCFGCGANTQTKEQEQSTITFAAPSIAYKEIDSNGVTAKYLDLGTDVIFSMDTLNSEYALSYRNTKGELASMRYTFRSFHDAEQKWQVVEDEVGNFFLLFDALDLGRIGIFFAKPNESGILFDKIEGRTRGMYVSRLKRGKDVQ